MTRAVMVLSENWTLVPPRDLRGLVEMAVSAEQLLEQVWDEHADPFTNTVAVTMVRLRRKLGDPPLIETVIGGGYRIP